jgi:hypothetical protein
MDMAHDDCFVVFVRGEGAGAGGEADGAERPLAAYPSYAEARRARQQLHRPGRRCVIRYVGPVGGGD